MNDLILLAALLEGPKHGWALKKLAGFLSGSGEMHNNLVYPLLKKFVAQGWVRRRSERGERGQTRAVYSLTLRGKQELMRRLERFGEREAASAPEFRVRVGLFRMLDRDSRIRILDARDQWLRSRKNHFASIRDGLAAMNATEWGREVVTFLLEEVRSERRWIGALGKKAKVGAPATKLPRS
jgi:DNA-binding PadR family transcriptional regulator